MLREFRINEGLQGSFLEFRAYCRWFRDVRCGRILESRAQKG